MAFFKNFFRKKNHFDNELLKLTMELKQINDNRDLASETRSEMVLAIANRAQKVISDRHDRRQQLIQH